MVGFIVCDGFDTQDLATQGSLGAVKKVSNPESNSVPKQPYPVRSLAGLVDFIRKRKMKQERVS
jgi:hypothetical protein